jgi:hypothetical protein
MPMSLLLMRPVRAIAAVISGLFMVTDSGDQLVTQNGDALRTI